MLKKLVNEVHWNTHAMQVRSRQLNETCIGHMNSAHITFVTLTEMQEKVNRKEIPPEDLAPYVAAALVAHKRTKAEFDRLIAEKAMLLEGLPAVQRKLD